VTVFRMDANMSHCGYTAHPRCMLTSRHSWSDTSTNLGRFRHRIEQKYPVTFGEYYCIFGTVVMKYRTFVCAGMSYVVLRYTICICIHVNNQ